MTKRIAINGAAGRMGKTLLSLVLQDNSLSLAQAFEHENHEALGQDIGKLLGQEETGVFLESFEKTKIDADAMIDFSLPEGTNALLDKLLENPIPYICGTTGLNETLLARIESLSAKAPVIHAPNFSLGVNLLFSLTKIAANALGEGTETEIVEAHHRHKKDAPSGTAIRLAEIAKEGVAAKNIIHGRSGITNERPADEVAVHALRGGEVIGEHTVYFYKGAERIELTHRAPGRDAFAGGAIQAAKWAIGKAAGRYEMADVLGLG